MSKPRIKLKAVSSRRPPTASNEQKASQILAELAPVLKMTVDEIRRDPQKARARREALERVYAGGRPAIGDLEWMYPGAVESLMVSAERKRALAIAKACQVTGQNQLLAKLVADGLSEEEATAYVFDVASAEGDRHGINNAHSPEGGHKAGIDHTAIYARHNAGKARRA